MRLPRLDCLFVSASLTLLLVLGVATDARAQRGHDPFANPLWSGESLARMLKQVKDALAAEIGHPLKPEARVLLSTREHAYHANRRIIRPIIKKLHPDKAGDEAYLRNQAQRAAIGVLGFYDPPKHTVHLVVENFRGLYLNEEFIRVVLTHELVHAYDFQDHKLWKRMLKSDPRQFRVWQAISEGHAQYITGRVMTRLGSLDEFQTYSDINFKIAHGVEDVFLHETDVQKRLKFFAYTRGHEFFKALEKTGRPELMNNAFSNPPQTVSTILHPDRLLIPPTNRPDPVDYEAALKKALGKIQPGWRRIPIPYDESVLQARFGQLVPTKRVDSVSGKFVWGSMVTSSPPPTRKTRRQRFRQTATCMVNQMSSGVAAGLLLDALETMTAKERAQWEAGDGTLSLVKAGKLLEDTRLQHHRITDVREYKDLIRTAHWVAFVSGPNLVECEFLFVSKSDPEMMEIVRTLSTELKKGGKPVRPFGGKKGKRGPKRKR
jgi:hypothetical protein